jgi:hypothetical protein
MSELFCFDFVVLRMGLTNCRPRADQRPKHDAGDRERGDHETNLKRRAAERRDVERKGGLQQRMLRGAEELRGTDENESAGPEPIGR